MPKDLGIKSSTVTAFLNDKLTPEQCKVYLTDSYVMAGDKTFGLNNNGGEFFLGNAGVDFDGDDLIIDVNTVQGNEKTLGFDNKEKTVLGLAKEEDKKNYEEIMLNSEALRNRKNP